jgi:hypothetical protein
MLILRLHDTSTIADNRGQSGSGNQGQQNSKASGEKQFSVVQHHLRGSRASGARAHSEIRSRKK